MPLYELPAEAWPLQVRSADAAMFTTVGRDPNPFERVGLYGRTLKELRIELQYLRKLNEHLRQIDRLLSAISLIDAAPPAPLTPTPQRTEPAPPPEVEADARPVAWSQPRHPLTKDPLR